MSVPKTQKITLKQIVENLDAIPNNGFGTEPPKMSGDQKKKLLQLSQMYENFGECLKNEESLMNAAKGITELCELAETYALNECGEWFQQEIVKKDMQNLKKRVSEFQKIVKETYARMQQAGVAYQDIGHVLGRYYDLKGTKGQDQTYNEVPGNQQSMVTLQEKNSKKKVSEAKGFDPSIEPIIIQKWKALPQDRKELLKKAMARPCSWCEGEFKKDLGGRNTGKSHGICRRHMAAQYKQMGKELPPSFGSGSFDLGTLSPEDRQLLGLLYEVIKRRQQKTGVWEVLDLG